MKKLITALLLTVCLLMVITAFAEGELFEYDEYFKSITSYSGTLEEIELPTEIGGQPVVSIGSQVLDYDENIRKVVVPEGYVAFIYETLSSCDNLESIELPKTLQYIGYANMSSLPKLTSIIIPESVCYVDYMALSWLDNIESITFLGKAPYFDEYALCGNNENCVYYVPNDCYDDYVNAMPEELNIQPSGANALPAVTGVADSDFEISEDGTITAYNGTNMVLVIPDTINGIPVTAIGESVFELNRTVYYMALPEGLVTIGNRAFATCSVNKMRMPSTLKTIGESAFSATYGIDYLLPDDFGLETIEANAFNPGGFSNKVEIPEGVKYIGDYAFADQSWLEEIYFPSTIEYIGAGAFSQNEEVNYMSFESAELPEIAPDAFSECLETVLDIDLQWDATREQYDAAKVKLVDYGFTNATVWRNNPSSAGVAEYIGSGSGYGYRYEDGMLKYFDGDISDISVATHINEDDGSSYNVIGIGEGVFKDNQTINSFWPHHCDWFTTISDEAFMNSSVAYVEMFDSITTIGARAFANCENLTEITLPGSLTSIGEGFIDGCTNLKKLTICCDLSIIPEGAFDGLNIEELVVNISDIPSYAFMDWNIKKLTLGSKVRNIDSGAFESCYELTEVVINEGCETIGLNAFRYCEKLASINIPTSVSSIKGEAFAGTAIDSFVISNSVDLDLTAIEDVSFTNISFAEGMTEEEIAAYKENMIPIWPEAAPVVELVEMPYAPTDESVFEFDAETGMITGYWGDAVDVVIPREIGGVPVRSIRSNAFDRCRDYTDTEVTTNQTEWVHLRTVIIPETLEELQDSAFMYCQQLENFICYAPLATTGRNTFALCRSIKNVVFVNGVGQIDNYAFNEAGPIETLYVGDYCARVGIDAFSYCAAEKLYLNASTIENSAIRFCPNLSEIHFGKRVKNIAGGAISECKNATTIYIEADNADMLSDEGIIATTASMMTVCIPNAMSDEAMDRTTSKLCMWSMEPAAVMCIRQECAVDHTYYELPEIADAPTASAVEEPAAEQPDINTERSTEGGEAFVGSWVSSDGMTAEVTIDGIITLTAGEETDSCAWFTENGSAYLDMYGSAIPMLIDGSGMLNIVADNMTLTFAKAGETTVEAPAAAPVAGGDVYIGSWVSEDGAYNAIIDADGTMQLGTDGYYEDASWTVSGGVGMMYGDGMTVTMMVDEYGRLIMMADNMTIVFMPEGEQNADVVAGVTDYAGNDLTLYHGEWYGIYLATGGATGDPREMYGLYMTMVLNPDYSATFDYGDPDITTWSVDENNIARHGDTALALLPNDRMQYGNEMAGYIIFSRDRDDIWDPATDTLAAFGNTYVAATEEPIVEAAAEPAPAPVEAGESPEEGKFIVTSWETQGMQMDPALLGGEYSVIFNADGSLTFTMVGVDVPGLFWEQSGDNILVTYYDGSVWEFVKTENGYDLDYYGSMLLHFTK